ncbi:L-idonate 5-dehydrogenase [Arthrobacter ruber]|uniref:L-idonate 5-dehydrogenase n=1 Tax=Arthrobacter ruber TaxID=1258893 RepID=UPI000CF3768E|nr:L-idonate 5-dehydrogenase [Arthrobacter ruber]
MRALVINGKLDLVETDVPTPEPGKGQVRLRMAFGGICGSDLHYYNEGANGEYVVREPLVPGHEVSGTVDSDPSGALPSGTPVTVHPATFGHPEPGIEDRRHLWPGGAYLGSASTQPHTQGGMSEFLIVDRSMVRPLPNGLSLRRAALAEPLAVGLHALTVSGGVRGKRVLVSGSGPIGLLTMAACLAEGAAEVVATDVLPGPLERARSLGVHRTIQIGTEDVPAMEFDVVLECSGVPAAVNAALQAARRAAIVVQVGMVPNELRGINLAPLISKELQLRGAFRFNDEMDRAIELLADIPAIEDVITHVLPASQALEAFAIAKDSGTSGKVVISLWHDER